MKKTTTKPKKVKSIADPTGKHITISNRNFGKITKQALSVNRDRVEKDSPALKDAVENSKPLYIPKKGSGICIICNDPVTNEPMVHDHIIHIECYNAIGDKKVRERIKELRNG